MRTLFAPTTVRRLRVAACAAAVAASTFGVAACSSSHHPAANAAPDTIVIKNFAFQPSTLVVAPGAKVTVHNEDQTIHTVTASGSTKAFDTGHIAGGATATFTAPTQTGTYPYICEIHQYMHGTLQVH